MNYGRPLWGRSFGKRKGERAAHISNKTESAGFNWLNYYQLPHILPGAGLLCPKTWNFNYYISQVWCVCSGQLPELLVNCNWFCSDCSLLQKAVTFSELQDLCEGGMIYGFPCLLTGERRRRKARDMWLGLTSWCHFVRTISCMREVAGVGLHSDSVGNLLIALGIYLRVFVLLESNFASHCSKNNINSKLS